MRKLFGTDGIRGTANVAPMTVEMMVKVGRAAAYLLSNKVNFPEQKEALIDLCGRQAINVLDKYFLN